MKPDSWIMTQTQVIVAAPNFFRRVLFDGISAIWFASFARIGN